jgi:hypothetical protein
MVPDPLQPLSLGFGLRHFSKSEMKMVKNNQVKLFV